MEVIVEAALRLGSAHASAFFYQSRGELCRQEIAAVLEVLPEGAIKPQGWRILSNRSAPGPTFQLPAKFRPIESRAFWRRSGRIVAVAFFLCAYDSPMLQRVKNTLRLRIK